MFLLSHSCLLTHTHIHYIIILIHIICWLECTHGRFHNKGFYLQLGLQKMVSKGAVSKLHQHITLFVDERVVNLPDCEGIVFLNIQSWGAGADPWGTANDPVNFC